MRLVKTVLLAASLALAVAAHAADAIGPGSAAPALDVKTWYKGKPVKGFDKNKIYVVEFWATWCGPCITSIPHVTKLAKGNKDVTFIGVSIWEDDKEDNIKKFIEKMGDKMDYNVGYSGNKTGMSASWMEPAGQNGIPAAFIIKDRKIQWVGHPMEMDKPLEEVKKGTFDIAKFKARFDKEAAETRAQMAAQAEINKLVKLRTSGDKAGASKGLDDLVAKTPALAGQADSIKFQWLAEDDFAAWEVKAKELLASKSEQQIQSVGSVAMRLSMKEATKPLARKAISLALEATGGNHFLANYYAMTVYEATGDTQLALDAVTALLRDYATSPVKDNADFKKAMEEKKAALTKKLGS